MIRYYWRAGWAVLRAWMAGGPDAGLAVEAKRFGRRPALGAGSYDQAAAVEGVHRSRRRDEARRRLEARL